MQQAIPQAARKQTSFSKELIMKKMMEKVADKKVKAHEEKMHKGKVAMKNGGMVKKGMPVQKYKDGGYVKSGKKC